MKTKLSATGGLFLLIILFQNCSDISVKDMALDNGINGFDTIDTGEITDPPGYSDIKQSCDRALAEGRMRKQIIHVEFKNPKKVCDWELNGNLKQRDKYIQARHEAERDLALMARSPKVCALKMNSEALNDFFYDDNILLTMNGYVIASTSNFTQHLDHRNGFYFYDWMKLVGKDAQNNKQDTTPDKQYCAGGNQGLAQCLFPETETYGKIELGFKDEIFQRIFALTTNDKVVLGIVTTGDNDPETDCQHVDLNFDVDVSYYE